jgi:coenzyme F420-reducing hydrogenase alpha subunit
MPKTIKVDFLTRVEGEGALLIRFKGKRVDKVELNIYEPPRFFEALLMGKPCFEAPDVTARICGICPVAYQMSSCHALEAAFGVVLPDNLRTLRRLLYTGEWLESHLLHMFLLHAPDFLGYPDAIHLAKDHPEPVRAALRMKKAGNAIVNVLGGREIHPINVRLGGFYRLPTREALSALLPELEWTRETMLESLQWMAGFEFPDLVREQEHVALRHSHDYPFSEGRIVSTAGLDIDVAEYEDHFEERQVPYSTALHAVLKQRGSYVCGPLPRLNLNADRLRPAAQRALEVSGLQLPCFNPFRSILARGVEVVQAADEAIAIIEAYDPSATSVLGGTGVVGGTNLASVLIEPRQGRGHGCTEAPRGILYHRYDVDAEGAITGAKIVPPTSQNQGSIEDDLRALSPQLVELPHAEATLLAERAVRNYDPCISCSTHFLKLSIEHEP